MFEPADRILVAVSGGKDSLALWDVLLELGYRADGLYLGLGIGEYSDARTGSRARSPTNARRELVEVDLARDFGFDVPTAGKKGSRSTCAVCGLSKRYVFNRAAREGGYDVIATGHNLDDEAATLLGNTLAMADRLHRAPVPGAAGGGGLRAQGQAALPALGARDRRVRVPARDRLRGRGVPARGREHAAPIQGRDEPNSNRPRPAPRRSSSSASWTGARRCSRRRTRSSSSGASDAASRRPAGSARSAARRRRSWASGSESRGAGGMNEAVAARRAAGRAG